MTTFIGTPGNDFQTTGWNNLYGNGGDDRLGADQPGVEGNDRSGGATKLYHRLLEDTKIG